MRGKTWRRRGQSKYKSWVHSQHFRTSCHLTIEWSVQASWNSFLSRSTVKQACIMKMRMLLLVSAVVLLASPAVASPARHKLDENLKRTFELAQNYNQSLAEVRVHHTSASVLLTFLFCNNLWCHKNAAWGNIWSHFFFCCRISLWRMCLIWLNAVASVRWDECYLFVVACCCANVVEFSYILACVLYRTSSSARCMISCINMNTSVKGMRRRSLWGTWRYLSMAEM